MGIISQLDELTAPATGDFLLAEDISDGSNKHKKLPLSRLADIYLKTSVRLVDASFANSAVPNRYTTISAAMSAASAGDTIMVGPGIYTETVTFSANGVAILGSGQPRYDSATGRLLGGTIIRGRIVMGAYVGTTILDLGVDTYDGTTGVDCIGATNPSTYADRTYRNLTLLGKGTADLAHGFYSIGDGTNIDNCRIYHCHHGIAVHGSYQNISNCWMYSCGGTSLVLKAKSTNNVRHINVSNIVMVGTDGGSSNLLAGPLAIQAEDSLESRYINIMNVSAINCVNGAVHVVLTGTGTIADVTINNVQSESNEDLAGVGDFRITTGTNIVLIGCGSNNRDAGYGFVQSGTAVDVRVYNSTADTSGSGAYSGTFDVLELNGDFWRPDGVILSPYSGHTGGRVNGANSAGSISVTGANTPIAILADSRNSISNDIGGILFVWARSATSTAGNSASYVLHVHTQYNGSPEVTSLSTLGLDTGSGASAPSFTFSIDFATHNLRATPIGSTSGSFYFSFAAMGHLSVLPL